MTTVNTIDKFGRSAFTKRVVLRGPSGTGFKLTKDNNYDIQGKCLKNVGAPVDGKDSVTRNYVDEKISATSQHTLNVVQETSNFLTTWVTNYIDGQTLQLKEQLKNEMENYVHAQNSQSEVTIKNLMAKNQEVLKRIKRIEDTLSEKMKQLDRLATDEYRPLAIPPHLLPTREIEA